MAKLNIPINGTKLDVAGMLSATSSMNTENASSTVSPNVTFSPLSGRIQKPVKVNVDNIMQGMMTLYI